MVWWTGVAMAGLGPVDTMVLFNADSPDATDVAAAYAEARHLPDGHQCGVTGIDPTTRSIDFATFDTVVRTAFDGCLAALPDPSRINVLVTVRGLPYLVELDTGSVGFEAALQVMHAERPDGSEVAGGNNDTAASVPNPLYIGGAPCPEAELTVTNPFSGWYRSSCNLTGEDRLPRSFTRARPLDASRYDFTDNLLVVGRLDGFDFDDARALIERSVDSDGSMPAGELLCMQSADQARGARDPECEYLVRRLQDVGANAVWLDTFEAELAGRELAALFTGAASFREGIAGNTWLPGAIACNLTSFGAVPNNFFCDKSGETCPERESQTSIARFVRAGATGAHGTVAEPLNNTFPDASTILLYQEGYTMGEAFLFSSEFLYWYNLVLGDPLAAPYAHRPEIVVAEPPHRPRSDGAHCLPSRWHRLAGAVRRRGVGGPGRRGRHPVVAARHVRVRVPRRRDRRDRRSGAHGLGRVGPTGEGPTARLVGRLSHGHARAHRDARRVWLWHELADGSVVPGAGGVAPRPQTSPDTLRAASARRGGARAVSPRVRLGCGDQ